MEHDELDFEKALQSVNWTEEHILHTPTFEVALQADETLYLRGAALREGFSPQAVQALTRFLSERVTLPPVEPPYDFPTDFTPGRVDVEREDTEEKQRTTLTKRELLDLVEYLGMVRGAEENPVIVRLMEKLEVMREEAFRAGREITGE